MTALCDRSAVALQGMLRRREISPKELLDSCLARIDFINGTLNAIVSIDNARAEWEANAAAELLRDNNVTKPLLGIPIGIKDVNRTQGLRTTFGSLLHEHDVPDADDATVAKLRAAGAIVLCKTNTPEFAAGSNTTNKVFGATLNPYDPAKTPGGSSGGSAAALATGMLPLAHGSDTGGSLRNPATWCGVVGFRPTPGLIPKDGRQVNFTHFGVQGPMARTVPDIALMMQGMVGFDARDPLSAEIDPAAFANLSAVDLSTLTVAWSADYGGAAPMDAGIVETFKARMADIAPLFKRCEERTPPFQEARDIFWVLRCVGYLANHKTRVEQHREMLSPNIVSNVEAGLKMSLDDVAWAEVAWSKLYREFQAFMDGVDLFIAPGNAVAPFNVADGIPTAVGGKPMENYVDASLIRSALTLTGHPVLALPCGLDHTGMPFGFQVTGTRRGDAPLLAACTALEAEIAKRPELTIPPPDLARFG